MDWGKAQINTNEDENTKDISTCPLKHTCFIWYRHTRHVEVNCWLIWLHGAYKMHTQSLAARPCTYFLSFWSKLFWFKLLGRGLFSKSDLILSGFTCTDEQHKSDEYFLHLPSSVSISFLHIFISSLKACTYHVQHNSCYCVTLKPMVLKINSP